MLGLRLDLPLWVVSENFLNRFGGIERVDRDAIKWDGNGEKDVFLVDVSRCLDGYCVSASCEGYIRFLSVVFDSCPVCFVFFSRDPVVKVILSPVNLS